MAEIDYKIIRRFGPSIFKVKIPNNIINQLNDYVDNIVNNWNGCFGAYPNLGIGSPVPNGNITKHQPMKSFISTMTLIIENLSKLFDLKHKSLDGKLWVQKMVLKKYFRKN